MFIFYAFEFPYVFVCRSHSISSGTSFETQASMALEAASTVEQPIGHTVSIYTYLDLLYVVLNRVSSIVCSYFAYPPASDPACENRAPVFIASR